MNQPQHITANISHVLNLLKDFIHEETIIVRSPGRINLIGEHTDYNNGFVLPAAIDKAAFFAITLRKDRILNLHSLDFNENYSTTVEELRKSETVTWPNYILGVVEQFKIAGVSVAGFDAALTGEIPLGAGLSSSAAVECAVAFALNEITKSGFDKLQLVKMSQRAENEFVGVRCGIMDQFASMFGIRDHVIRLDCQSLEYDYVPLKMDGFRIVLFDSKVKHSLASSEYNVRRSQCESGVEMVQRFHPEVKSLRDVTMNMITQHVLANDALIFQRCKYVIEENKRLLDACEDLKAGKLQSFGKKMFATHDGLSREYEVSCAELDFLVDSVRNNPNVMGARMMGGGFGGCTINLVKDTAVEELIQSTAAAYKDGMNKELLAYAVSIADGTSRLE